MPVDLPAVLDALCARTGARSARVVDGRVGAVVAVSGDPGTADPVDGPSAVARLLHEAGPDPRTADRGDVCVTTPHSVHLLRPVVGAPEAFVHLRLAGDGEVDRARSTLAEPLLHELVRSALHGTDPRPASVVAPGAGGGRGRATVPGPRTAGDDLAARPPTVTVPAQAPLGRGPAGGGGPAPAPRRGAPPVPLRPARRPGTRMPVPAAPTGPVDPAAETVRLAAVRPADRGPAAATSAVRAAATAATAASARAATTVPAPAAPSSTALAPHATAPAATAAGDGATAPGYAVAPTIDLTAVPPATVLPAAAPPATSPPVAVPSASGLPVAGPSGTGPSGTAPSPTAPSVGGPPVTGPSTAGLSVAGPWATAPSATAPPVAAPPLAAPVAPADSADQPALAVLAGRPRLRDAALAAAAVAGLAAALPRRTPGRVVTGTGRVSGLPRLHWTEDPSTLHRVLGGLHRLN